jgi:hypothetical protein
MTCMYIGGGIVGREMSVRACMHRPRLDGVNIVPQQYIAYKYADNAR